MGQKDEHSIPRLDLGEFRFSPPGPMGWEHVSYDDLLENLENLDEDYDEEDNHFPFNPNHFYELKGDGKYYVQEQAVFPVVSEQQSEKVREEEKTKVEKKPERKIKGKKKEKEKEKVVSEEKKAVEKSKMPSQKEKQTTSPVRRTSKPFHLFSANTVQDHSPLRARHPDMKASKGSKTFIIGM